MVAEVTAPFRKVFLTNVPALPFVLLILRLTSPVRIPLAPYEKLALPSLQPVKCPIVAIPSKWLG